jgi:multicomponent Na+:H+ antiporter subunit G
VLNTITYVLIGIGLFFNLMAGVGLLRFPDYFTRLHAGTKCTTFGSIFLIGAVMLQFGAAWVQGGWDASESVIVTHSAIALLALLVTNPTGAHAIARAGYRSGIKPVQAVVDDLENADVND